MLPKKQHYEVITKPPHTGLICSDTFKHDVTGNRPTQRQSEFSGSVDHQCKGLQDLTWPSPAISCADMQFSCVSSRGNSDFFNTSAGKWALLSLASQTMLLLHTVSEPISHDSEVQYRLHNHLITLKWAHYCISRSHKGYDCGEFSLSSFSTGYI